MAGQFGISDAKSALVRTTADGVRLVDLWEEIQQLTSIYQVEKDDILALLTYTTTSAADAIPTSLTPQMMEEASEFGVPVALRPEAPHLVVGYDLKDYDLASRMSYRFLRSATAEQVRAAVTRMIEADRHTIQSRVLHQLFSPTTRRNEFGTTVYPAYNGSGTADNLPPSVRGRTFTASHSHFVPTGSVDLDSEDVELLCKHVQEHGYGRGGRSGRMVLMFNPDDIEASAMTSWRAGVESDNGKLARFDFIVSPTAAPYLTNETVVGEKPPAEWEGIPIIGSYGASFVCSSEVVPAGYFAAVATHGANQPGNAVAFREHEKPEYRGLQFMPGGDVRAYPLSESFSVRTFGTGLRRRGAVAVAQLTAGSYTAPTEFAL